MLPALKDVPLDRESIEQSKLDIQERSRRNLLTWNGQFSPQLVHALLDCHAADGDLVLDPFAGSGTTLVESGRLGLRAVGTEINPAACYIAQVYSLINASERERDALIRTMSDTLDDIFPQPLFRSTSDSTDAEVQDALVRCWQENSSGARVLIQALIVQLDFYKAGLSIARVFSTWKKLSSVIRELPFSDRSIELVNADARSVPLDDGSVDLVLTSPPYINVFNYHQQFRRSVEALGWRLLDVARSEIGSNRKNRGNRFLTVIQFCLDMADVLSEMKRVVKRSGKMLFVVGRESNVRKTSFLNGDIVAKLAVGCCGLTLVGRQERVYKNKFGKHIHEDILNLKPSRKTASCTANDVARMVLEDAIPNAPEESLDDLRDALHAIGSIEQSPLYVTGACGNETANTSPGKAKRNSSERKTSN